MKYISWSCHSQHAGWPRVPSEAYKMAPPMRRPEAAMVAGRHGGGCKLSIGKLDREKYVGEKYWKPQIMHMQLKCKIWPGIAIWLIIVYCSVILIYASWVSVEERFSLNAPCYNVLYKGWDLYENHFCYTSGCKLNVAWAYWALGCFSKTLFQKKIRAIPSRTPLGCI